MMLPALRPGSRPGFLLLEVLIGMAVFAVFMGAVGLTLLFGQESTIMSGDRIRAVYLTEQALEAGRAIRDGSFSALTAGQHGVYITSAGVWAFTGSFVTSSGGFVTHVNVVPIEDDHVRLTAQTRWKRGYNRSGSVLLTTELADWRSGVPLGNWSSVSVEGSYTDAGTPLFNRVAVKGTYIFVTSEISDGGKGLYVFDTATLAVPVRVATSFNLGYAGYDLLVKGNRLYVLTSDAGAELQVYDIAVPAEFSSSKLVTSYNLPGSGLGRSMALRSATLIVGALESAVSGQDELYAFDVSDDDAVILQDSINDTSGFLDIAVTGTSAFLATTNNGAELKAARVDQPAALVLPVNEGYNATDVQDGTSIAVSGTSAVLGRSFGSVIEELMLLDLEGGGGFPAPPPGPWFHEVGGSVNDMVLDPTGCLAFVASDFNEEEFQIVRIRRTLLPEVAVYNATSGAGRGIAYDTARDRVFLVTNTAMHVLKPASGSIACP